MQKHGFGNPFQKRAVAVFVASGLSKRGAAPPSLRSIRMDPTKTKTSKCNFTSILSSVLAPQTPLEVFEKKCGSSWTIVIRRQPSSKAWVLALIAAVQRCRATRFAIRAAACCRRAIGPVIASSNNSAKKRVRRTPRTRWPPSHRNVALSKPTRVVNATS